MTVKDLIIKLLDKPMDAEVQLQTDSDKEDVSGVLFDIDSVERWTTKYVMISFTDWRKEREVDEAD